MEPKDFKAWRRAQKLSQKEAANVLGLKRRMIQYYEKGERDGVKVVIPLAVRLACYAVTEGIADYKGPNRKIVFMEPKLEKTSAAKPKNKK
ncbi:MAG: helix-turn-helix transcriptional regulator [Pseudomonadota bacterium]